MRKKNFLTSQNKRQGNVSVDIRFYLNINYDETLPFWRWFFDGYEQFQLRIWKSRWLRNKTRLPVLE